jgi:hypothetical protein
LSSLYITTKDATESSRRIFLSYQLSLMQTLSSDIEMSHHMLTSDEINRFRSTKKEEEEEKEEMNYRGP